MTVDLSQLQKGVEDISEALGGLKQEESTLNANIETLQKQQKVSREETEEAQKGKAQLQGEVEILKEERGRVQKEIDLEKEHSDTIFLKKEKEFTELWEKKNKQLRDKESEINEKLQEAIFKIEKEKAKYKTKQNITIEATEDSMKIQIKELKLKQERLDKRESFLNYKIRIYNKKEIERKQKQAQLEDRVKTFQMHNR